MNGIEELLNEDELLEKYMNLALDNARASLPEDVPVGVVVLDITSGEIIGSGGNSTETKSDPTNHAEIVAIKQACEHIGDWRLNNCILFSTLEPCVMCAGALFQSRIGALVYGTHDRQYGAAGSIYDFLSDSRLNHNAPTRRGILEEQCKSLLDEFFFKLRNAKK